MADELQPCPKGFALNDDEVYCYPVFDECPEFQLAKPGGGCIGIGPTPDIESEHNCGVGETPLPSGGCLKVGPRTCPKLWASESDVDCSVQDVMACPSGWIESDDQSYCKPVLNDCNNGELVRLNGACDSALVEAGQCGNEAYDNPPDGASEVLYVDYKSACISQCGSIESPYASIQEAVLAATAGAAILVAEGTYFEGLLIDRPLSILGVCPGSVVLSGSVEVQFDEVPVKESTILIGATKDVTLSGFRIIGEHPGVTVVEAHNVKVSNVHFDHVGGTAVYVSEDADCALTNVWINGVTASDKLPGYGIFLDRFAEVTLLDVLVDEATQYGVYAKYYGKLSVQQSSIQDTQTTASGFGGHGIRVKGYSELEVEDSFVARNFSGGIAVSDSVDAFISRTAVLDTKAEPASDFSSGIYGLTGANVRVSECFLEGNVYTSLYSDYNGTSVIAERSVVIDSVALDEVSGLAGLVKGSARLEFKGCVLLDGEGSGIIAVDSDSMLDVTHSVISDNKSPGIQVLSGASLVSSKSLITRNKAYEIVVIDAESQVILEDTLITDTVISDTGLSGYGIAILDGGSALLRRSAVLGNSVTAIFSGDSSSPKDAPTHLVLEDSIVAGTRPTEAVNLGHGIQVANGGSANLLRSLITDNYGVGVYIGEDGSSALIEECTLAETKAAGAYNLGLGIRTSTGAFASLTGTLIDRNQGMGILVDSHSEIEVRKSAIRGTLFSPDGESAWGIVAGGDTRAEFTEVLVEKNGMAGVGAILEGTTVIFKQSVIRDHVPEEHLVNARAGQISLGADLELQGCVVEGNTGEGFLVFDPGTSVLIERTIIRNQHPDTEGNFGDGVTLMYGAKGTVRHSMFVNNTTSALIARDPETELIIDQTLVAATLPGGNWVYLNGGEEYQSFGDGVYCEGATTHVSSSIVSNNGRTGLFYHDGKGVVAGSLILANSSYGLALKNADSSVTHDAQGNIFSGNAFELPDNMALEVTDNPGGLPVPEAPIPASINLMD